MPDAPVSATTTVFVESMSGGQVAMTDQYRRLVAELASEPFGEVRRAVPAAGAADGDREGISMLPVKGGQPGFDELADVARQRADLGLALEKSRHFGVEPRPRLQLRLVERIGNAAHVEHQVGVERDPLLVSER